LLAVANGTPVIATKILGKTFAYPVDFGIAFCDGQPLFGASKTLRGIVLAVLLTSVAAPLIGLDWTFGALIAVTAMFGDLLSSFIKRRMGLIPSSQCIGLDQIPESLLPLVACRFLLRLTILEIAAATVIFFFGELALSRVLFWLRIRERPY
jgi:CDP-2,3-bis-(O-geranylgeranyl)-sn-glycerol synthase